MLTTSSDVTHVGALVSSGGTLTFEAKKTVDILGSTVTAKGNASIVGKQGVTIASVLDEHDASASGGKSGFLTKTSYGYNESSISNVGSLVAVGGNLTVRSERGDITVAASNVSAGKDLAVLAGYDAAGHQIAGTKASVNVLSGQDVADTAYAQKKSGFGLFPTGGGIDFYHATQTTLTTASATNVASSLSSGGNLFVGATRDINVIGSAVMAKGTATLHADRDVNIGPGQDASGSDFSKKVKGVGLSTGSSDGGFSVSAGYHSQSQYAAYSQTSVAQSVIYGGKGVGIAGPLTNKPLR